MCLQDSLAVLLQDYLVLFQIIAVFFEGSFFGSFRVVAGFLLKKATLRFLAEEPAQILVVLHDHISTTISVVLRLAD